MDERRLGMLVLMLNAFGAGAATDEPEEEGDCDDSESASAPAPVLPELPSDPSLTLADGRCTGGAAELGVLGN